VSLVIPKKDVHIDAMEQKQNRQVTTRDIAEALSVNQSTISRALRNDPKVSESMREKVRRCAEKLGYKPNPFVAAFTAQVRGYRRSPQGAVLGLLEAHKPSEQLNLQYQNGARRRAAEHGFTAEVFHLHALDYSLKRLKKILWTRSIFGLLVLPVPLGFDLTGFDFSRLASATVDPTLHNPSLHRAESNYFQGMQLALEELERRGYWKAAFCTTRMEQNLLGHDWLGGFTAWQAMRDENLRMSAYIGENWEEKPFRKWLKENKPDAIVTNTPLFFSFASRAGFFPPKVAHVSLAAGDDAPGMAGVCQNQENVGAAAVDIIVAQIHRNDYGLPKLRKTILIDSSWLDGDSAPGKPTRLSPRRAT
jgi:LacI family transcriptional regulator